MDNNILLLKYNKYYQLGTLGRQPIVSVMEDLIEKTTEKWTKTDDKLEQRMDKLLELQQ